MELGEKLLQARLEAGMSQRQLCGEEITRNMLSQIEHGTARPSMTTLRYLASRLEKPVSYFLEEDAVVSPNQQMMADARTAYDAGAFAVGMEALESYQAPDAVYDREYGLLQALMRLSLAEDMITQGKEAYARELLEQPIETGYCAVELERRRLLLLGRLQGADLKSLCEKLPGLDEELLLRAQGTLAEDADRAANLLAAVEDQTAPQWHFMMGEVHLRRRNFSDAARCFHSAEAAYPRETAIHLERCYREMEDYKKAYFYACKQR